MFTIIIQYLIPNTVNGMLKMSTWTLQPQYRTFRLRAADRASLISLA